MQSEHANQDRSKQIDRLCDEFELAWKNGHPQRIEQVVKHVSDDLRSALFDELLLTEWELLADAGHAVVCASYVERFPDQADGIKQLFAKRAAGRVESPTPSFESPTAQRPLDENLPSRIGKYEVMGKIDRGGMGVIYEARHPDMDRVVAIKVVSETILHEQQSVERFLREIKATAKLTHTNIVTAFDAGKHEGSAFLVMERLDGMSLDKLVKKQGPLSAAEAIDYIIQSAQGLRYIHRRSIVHRDVKPANLFLTNDGVIKVLDLGLAGLRDGEQTKSVADPKADTINRTLTDGKQILGSPLYISPEQATGDSSDRRADIYSLGCTLYFLLTGNPPFSGGSTQDCIRCHIEQDLPDLPTTSQEDRRLQQLISRMTKKSPHDRCQSMDEVIDTLAAEIERPKRILRWAPAVATIILLGLVFIAFQRGRLAPLKTARSATGQPNNEVVPEYLPSTDAVWEVTTDNFCDCCLLADGRGWAVGLGGKILATRDHGDTWYPQVTHTRNNLIGLCMVSGSDGNLAGWAVGHHGTILSTQDGLEWNPQASGVDLELRAVYFIDQQRGWAVGRTHGRVLMTNDGGHSWDISDVAVQGEMRDVFFVDASPDPVGWVVGDEGQIYRTIDGGQTWLPQDSNTDRHLEGCFFLNKDIGWLVAGNGVIRRSLNGGIDWLKADYKSEHLETIQQAFFDVHFINRHEGWISGNETIHTVDGGETWTREDLGTGNFVRGISLLESGDGLAVGQSNLISQRIRGKWEVRKFSPQPGFVSGLHAVNRFTVFSVDRRIRMTKNGGDTWEDVPCPSDGALTSIHFFDQLHGCAVGVDGQAFCTDNGGKNFVRVATPPRCNDVFFTSVHCQSAEEIWIVGDDGMVLNTKNLGTSWDIVPFSRRLTLRDIDVAGDLLCVVGDGGTILTRRHGDDSWSDRGADMTFIESTIIRSVDLINEKEGWIVGDHGLIAKTSDGGENWKLADTPINSGTWRDVEFVDAQHGWIVGFKDIKGLDGVILCTDDGGETWVIQSDGSEGFGWISFSEGVGWAASGRRIPLIWRLE